jgi:hypothetical protein
MSAPNLLGLTTVLGQTGHLACTNSMSTVVGATATNHLIRVEAVYATNITSSPHIVSCNHVHSSTNYQIAYQMTVPANATINLLDGKPLYLEEGDTLQCDSDASSQIVINAPYEDLS